MPVRRRWKPGDLFFLPDFLNMSCYHAATILFAGEGTILPTLFKSTALDIL